MVKNLKNTLNLPKTKFPMRANLAKREPARLQHWESQKVYESVLEKNKDGDLFVLPDGPPYANGNIHMGHALNKILKDIVIRYQSMKGRKVPYVPGWDCHGLPIEQQILKKIGSKIHDMDPIELRKLCAEYAQEFIDIQREQFKRLGILADWENPYTTFDPKYEYGILNCLLALVKKGLIQKGHKAVSWDPVFRTALAEAEIEYHEHESDSIYVSFPLCDAAQYPSLKDFSKLDIAIVIWTTTPWTLPANLGVSLHPEFTYVLLSNGEKAYMIAEGLLESFREKTALTDDSWKVLTSFKANEFDRGQCKHPIFDDKTSLIMLGEHVTLEQGTGCVHTAPGHGADDFIIGKAYGLPIFVPVDDKGCYTDEYPEMEGTFVFNANAPIIEKLDKKGILLGHHKIKHEYPFSWRSKKPIIFRATEQWFFKLEDGVREASLKAIDEDVQWIPTWGRDRIRSMVERRPEWCISRQRSWGVPIPSIRSKKSGDSLLIPELIERFMKIVKTEGTDAWFSHPLETFFPEGYIYEKTGESSPDDFEKESDILDVWFDSGSSHIASLESDDRLRSPADLYLEGSDQHRGWFQAALLTSIGARNKAPFKAVLTHGFILDGQGRAMSKSLGNVISPLDLIKTYGADIIRFWVNSLDYTNDVGISDEILANVARAYRDVRNTLRFLIGNLYDFDATKDALPTEELMPLDKWALHQLNELLETVTAYYDNYEFHRAYSATTQFCTVTLSSLYHDILKDRLYTYGPKSKGRRSAQTALYHILDVLSKILAPALPFTCDEARSYWKKDEDFSDHPIQLEDWPQADPSWKNEALNEDFIQLLEIRDTINEKLESLRQEKIIGKSIDAAVHITGSAESSKMKILQAYEDVLPEFFIVSQVILDQEKTVEKIRIEAKHATGKRCPRSLRWVENLVDTKYGKVSKRCAEALTEFS